MTDRTERADSTGLPAGAPTVPAGWEGILAPDERILWQGRPDGAFRLDLSRLPLILFGLVFAGFALFWMIGAAMLSGGWFWSFGLIHFSVGLGVLFSATWLPVMKRRRTWYTLTDKRAFIARNLPTKGRTLESYTITPDTRLRLEEGPPDSVYFGREERRGNKGRVYQVDIGFERIAEGKTVYGLLRDLQRAAEAERGQ